MANDEETNDAQPPPLVTLVGVATSEFNTLVGRRVEGVSGVRAEDGGGYSLLIDALELERIPDSTSVLGTYRVTVDTQGHMTGYERVRRYNRGTTDRQ